MAVSRQIGLLLVALVSLVSIAAAFSNATYQDVDLLKAKLLSMEDRPGSCPPWYVSHTSRGKEFLFMLNHY